MTDRSELLDESPPEFDAAFKERLHALVDAWGTGAEAASAANHQPLLEAARELVSSKLSMSGTKSETRRRAEALINTHLQGIFSAASGSDSESCEPLGLEISEEGIEDTFHRMRRNDEREPTTHGDSWQFLLY